MVDTYLETKLMCKLLELQYGNKEVIKEIKALSKNIDWICGWPEKKEAFWSAQAFMWQHRIDKETRNIIKKKLEKICSGKILDLGAGAYSYLPCTAIDCSKKMLTFNDNATERIVGDIEKKLPFKDSSFDCVLAVFVLNYVNNLDGLFNEIKRILRGGGNFVVILSNVGINNWHAQKQVQNLSQKEWVKVFYEGGFNVKVKNLGEISLFNLNKT